MEINLFEGEKIDFLHTGGLKIIQNKKKFCFGMDAVLLADFAFCEIEKEFEILQKKSVFGGCAHLVKTVDFCAGNGIVPVLIAGALFKSQLNFKNFHISALEIQKEISEMAQKSVYLNHLENLIEIKNGDLKESRNFFDENSFDFATCNPPYVQAEKGRQSGNLSKMIARQEICCSLQDVLDAAFYVLKNGGHFFMIHRPERFDEICEKMQKTGFALKKFRFVKPFKNENAKMVLFDAEKSLKNDYKSANSGFEIEIPPLVVYKEKGVYTDETEKIYGRKAK